MKEKFLIAVTFAAFVMLGCSLQLPEKVSVKTDATYEFMLGKMDKSLEDRFDLGATSLGSSGNMKMYGYRPNGDTSTTKKNVILTDFYDVDLDFAEFFKNTKISDSVGKMSFSQEVSIPKFDKTDELAQTVSQDAVANVIAVSGKPISSSPQTFVVVAGSVSYGSSATASISFTGSPSGVVTLTTGSVSKTGNISGSSASIDISNFTIDSSTTIKCASGSGTFTLAVAPGAVVRSASNISLELTTPVTQNINITMDPQVKESTIGTGEIRISAAVPGGWSGSISVKNVNVTGAFSANSTNGTISLNNKTFSTGSISVTANYALDNVSFSSFGDGKFTGNVKLEIGSLASVVVTAPTDIETSVDKEQDLSDEYKNMIEQVVFKKSGLKGKYTNTFPAGNDFKLKAKSNFIGLTSEGTQDLYGNTTNADIAILAADVPYPQTITSGSKVDFKAGWELPNWNPVDKTYKVVNLIPEQKYKFSVELEPELNWTEVTIRANDGLSPTDNVSKINIDVPSMLAALGPDLSEKFSLHKLPVYLFCEKPSIEALNDIKLKGHIVAGVKVSDTGNFTKEPTNILGTPTQDSEMPFAKMPDIIKNDNGVVLTNFAATGASVVSDLAEQLNHTFADENEKLYVKSKVALTIPRTTITKEQMDSLSKEHRAISIKVAIEVPFDFNVKGNTPDEKAVYLNLGGLFGGSSEGDLFGRSEATDINNIQKYISIINSAKLVYKSKVAPFKSFAADGTETHVSIEVDFNSTGVDKKTFDFNGGPLVLTRSEFEALMKTYPLKPSIKVKIPVGQFMIQQDVKMEGSLMLKVESAGEIPIFGGN